MTSFDIVSLGYPTLTDESIGGIVKSLAKTFEMAFNMGAPIIISILVIDIVLGILSRSIPQLNVLIFVVEREDDSQFYYLHAGFAEHGRFLASNFSEMIQNMADFIKSIA